MTKTALPNLGSFTELSSSTNLRDIGDFAAKANDLTQAEIAAQMNSIYARGDRITVRFILLHAIIALALAPFYETWFVSGVVAICALLMFVISVRILPRSFITRCIAGLSLQTFVALHIYQLHGMAEMHFFFFTGFTVLIVYQDWKCFWPGALGIIVQHTAFAVLHNSGVQVYFFEPDYVSATKLFFHFGIALGQVGICGYWAHLLKRQTLGNARKNLWLRKINDRLHSEMEERKTAEAAVKVAEAQFRGIAANIPGMVYQYVLRQDGTHYFPFLNDGCRDLLGVDPSKGYDDPELIFAVTHPDDRERLFQSIRKSADDLSPWKWEGRTILASGEEKWIQGLARPEQRDDGSILWNGVLMDATERKRAEADLHAEMAERRRVEAELSEAEGRYQRVADNMPGVVYQFIRRRNGTFGFPFMSGGCREVFELEPEAVTDERADVFSRIHPEDRPALFKSISESADALLPWRWEGRLVMETNRIKWIQGASRPQKHRDGTIVWDGVVVDVTESKRVEVELRLAKEEAERANLAKSEFLSRMSHELRTPLNAILGFGQLLEARPLSPRQAESVRHILKGGRHLLGLINEVLDISRIESGHMQFSIEPIRVSQVLEEAAALVRPLAEQRGIRLSVPEVRLSDSECYAMADVQRFKQVVINLLSNAIKYNRDGGEVILTCEVVSVRQGHSEKRTAGSKYPDRIRVGVRDTGPGISKDQLPRLFIPFERLGAERTQIEGAGVGLALSKRLMEAMNGTIGVESEPGRGSTFFIELSAAPSPEENLPDTLAALAIRDTESGNTGADQIFRKRRIVLQVEDNLANRHLMEQVLACREDLQLLTAIQGGIAVELAREHRPALILLDLHLPDIPGAEVLARLRADSQTREIPIVVVSADATANQIQRLLAMGARKYLTKPFDIAELLATIDEIVPDEED